jgi:hypothetical protein
MWDLITSQKQPTTTKKNGSTFSLSLNRLCEKRKIKQKVQVEEIDWMKKVGSVKEMPEYYSSGDKIKLKLSSKLLVKKNFKFLIGKNREFLPFCVLLCPLFVFFWTRNENSPTNRKREKNNQPIND